MTARMVEAERLNQIANLLSSHTPGNRLPLSVRYAAARLADEFVTMYLDEHERWLAYHYPQREGAES